MALEFASKVRRIPVYPAADGYASEGEIAMMASNESPYPPVPAVVEAITKALSGLNRYPDPTNAAISSSGSAVEVGVFGLQTITSRVATLISRRIASRSWRCSASSGTSSARAPDAAARCG